MGNQKLSVAERANMMKLNLAFLLFISAVVGIHGMNGETTPAREVCQGLSVLMITRKEVSSSRHHAAQNSVTAAMVCRTNSLVRIPWSLMRLHRFATGVTTCAISALTAADAHNLHRHELNYAS